MDITHQICTRMREVGLSVTQISDELQIDPATYYRKLQSGGMKFTLAQLQRLTELKLRRRGGTAFFSSLTCMYAGYGERGGEKLG